MMTHGLKTLQGWKGLARKTASQSQSFLGSPQHISRPGVTRGFHSVGVEISTTFMMKQIFHFQCNNTIYIKLTTTGGFKREKKQKKVWISYVDFGHIIPLFTPTRRYSPLCGLSSSSCGGLWPICCLRPLDAVLSSTLHRSGLDVYNGFGLWPRLLLLVGQKKVLFIIS